MICRLASALSSLFLLAGCAYVIEGQSQNITINTTPEGANCTLARADETLGEISQTPGSISIEKTKDDILIKCTKDGYLETTYLNKSGYPKYNWAYILIGGPVGWGIDSATGADNEYVSPVSLELLKN